MAHYPDGKENRIRTAARNLRNLRIPFKTRKQLTVRTRFTRSPDPAQRTLILSRIRFSETYK
jgi:hypothetical protein